MLIFAYFLLFGESYLNVLWRIGLRLTSMRNHRVKQSMFSSVDLSRFKDKLKFVMDTYSGWLKPSLLILIFLAYINRLPSYYPPQLMISLAIIISKQQTFLLVFVEAVLWLLSHPHFLYICKDAKENQSNLLDHLWKALLASITRAF